ncbi:hypothetical protein [uncultured Sphingomonas sp.]|uniref:hypothetical protein n=1 Tax=uncultured Sphingomonas sp. TaxID=158754 RepID=UPI0035CCA903
MTLGGVNMIGLISGLRFSTGTGLDVQGIIARNSTALGVDARSLAADLGELSAPERGRILAQLSPAVQGGVLRALDHQAGPAGPVQAAATTTKGAKPKPDPLGIGKLFGADTAALAAKSPSLSADLRALQAKGWKVELGVAGGGSFADKVAKRITVDRNQIGKPAAAVQTLAHEAGHARYVAKADGSSREAYIKSNLRDEGAATLSNIRAQREIKASGGADIGIAGSTANQAAYNKAYDAYAKDNNLAKVRDAIGTIYGNGERTSNTGQAYRDYYGSAYDAAHPPKKP